MRVVKSLLQRSAEVVGVTAAPGPSGVSAIAQALALPKSAAHRLLREMCATGWMERDGADALTLRFALLGQRILHAGHLPDLVQPVLDDLARQTRERVRLATATDDTLVWIAAAQGAPPGLPDRILDGDVPRPRGHAARRNPIVLHIEEGITNLLLSRGILHGATA